MTTQESIITDEMRAQVGVESRPWVMEVERGAIQRFAEAIGDPNPLFYDEEYAKRSRHGGIIAPVGFFGWPVGEPPPASTVESPFIRRVNGGNDFTYNRPIYAGERLIASRKLAEANERQGSPRTGRMLFLITETTYRDLSGKVVAISRNTGISYEGPTSS